jgi:tryptophanyl-tRNA synthetase
MKEIVLTGIKPSGTPHLGNYSGMIKPALDLVDEVQALYFIADYHALTTVKVPENLDRQVYEVAATWLALGLNPEKVIFYRQSAIPEVFELTWILSCFAAKGLLNRAHAYKTAVDANLATNRDPDADINAGLYNYPVLMAADILLFGTRFVPIGPDQKQHLEITRDIAAAVNTTCGPMFRLPEPLIRDDVLTVPGLDGRKMSKNYGNIIPIFAEPEVVRKRVMQIKTDSKRPEDPKNPEECTVFAIYRHVAPPAAVNTTRRLYEQGGLSYHTIKEELAGILEERFGPLRSTYKTFLEDRRRIDQILTEGALKARRLAAPVINDIRKKIGIRR